MSWEAITAVSVAVMAIMWIILVVGLLLFVRGRRRLFDALERLSEMVEREGRPVLASARSAVDDAGKTVQTIRTEVEQIVGTSRDLRSRVQGATAALEERVHDLETVLNILQEEIEETVLDIAAALRTTRRGASIARALKRAVLGWRR